ncbi:hypothetical protein PHYPSEUDO_009890 [Phytophthora pseudosyringae]|uniref:Uncharacterized protein n=1 Tax=Phytophthora pseudosyringae TaxID=221518 RepID=A0A8T1VBA8_9STRA|nr:hypothetical protein PHYPSEUDO_009890 [Phytophthora pseudosyringae]
MICKVHITKQTVSRFPVQMVSSPRSSSSAAGGSAPNGRSSASRGADASTGASPASSNGAGPKRQLPEPEVIALNELLDTFPAEMDDAQHEGGASAAAEAQKRRKLRSGVGAEAGSYQRYKPRRERDEPDQRSSSRAQPKEDEDTESENEREKGDGNDAKGGKDRALSAARSGPVSNAGSTGGTSGRHTRLTDLEQHVRGLERDNLHLKQALLLGKNAARRNVAGAPTALASLGSLSSLAGVRGMGALGAPGAPGVESRANVQRMLAERTKVVTEMVEQLNAAYLSLGDASRVWHEDCRIGVGVREWDAFGRLQTISLWNMIRSVFTSIVVDIVELRPHLPDGEMILTKWRIQGEIASAQHLERVCASEDCPATMRVALMAIKSSDLTFTVTTYVVFQELRIAEQHHCWDQVGVFKRLFGGEIPPSVQNMLVIDEETVAGRKQPLEV